VLISSDADAISPAEARRLSAEGFLPKSELPSAPLRRLLTGE
jgi:hypothetical protein